MLIRIASRRRPCSRCRYGRSSAAPLRCLSPPLPPLLLLLIRAQQHCAPLLPLPLPSRLSHSQFPVPGSWFPVPGSRFSVLGSRFPVLGSRFLVPGSWFPVPGSWFPVLGSRFPVPGSRFSVPGSWFSVLGSWFSVPGSRFSVLGSRFSVLGSPLPRRHISAAEERLTIERRLAFGRAGAHI